MAYNAPYPNRASVGHRRRGRASAVRDGDKVNGTGTVLNEVKRSWNKSPDAQRRSVLCREMALDGAVADTMGAAADASSEALTAFALATGHRPASRDQCM